MRLILPLVLLLAPSVVQAQQTITVPAGGNLQAAINTAPRGSKIVLEAGATYTGNFNLIDKGPCTGAESEFITITTSDPSGTPAALFGYPQFDVRITSQMAARMPKVLTPNAYPAFWVNAGAKCWRLKGLDISNTATSGTVIRLIGFGEQIPNDRSLYPSHIIIEQNLIRPHEEDGSPYSTQTLRRTAQNSIYAEGTNWLIQHNAFQGFVSDTALGTGFANILITTWADNIVVRNNLMEAFSYTWLIGGGGGLFPDPAQMATVSNCTATSCVFSHVNGITVGMPVAVFVYEALDNLGVSRKWWGNAYVASINGSTVTWQKPLCTAGNDPLQNTCLPFNSSNLRTIPADGSQARWGGFQPQNITIQRNLVAHRDEWTKLLGICSGKGYFELKTGLNILIEGNRFKGCDGVTITARNQTGSDPFSALHGLTVRSNYFENGNNDLDAFLQDNRFFTARSRNVIFDNNLIVGQFINPGRTDAFISYNFSGGENTRVTRNTILVGNQFSFRSFAPNTMTGLVMRDNIFRAAINGCYDYSSGQEVGALIGTCWPGADVQGNVLMSIDRWRPDEIAHWWTTPYPNNRVVTSVGAVGFTAPDAGLTAAGNYRLLPNSPFAGKGVNYTELESALGYSISSGQPIPSPSPTVSPTPVSTPTPQPSPTAAPTPRPSVSPTPRPSPLPTPIRPGLQNVALASNGATVTASSTLVAPPFSYSVNSVINGDYKGLNAGANSNWAGATAVFPQWVEIAFNGSKTISEIGVFTLPDEYHNPVEPTEALTFTRYGLTGFEVQYWNGSAWVTIPGGVVTGNNKVWKRLVFAPVTTGKIRILTTASIDGFSRIVEVEAWGGVVAQPTPTPTPPPPPPTPTPTPTPVPTPSPSPSPSPTPVSNIETTDELWPATETEQRAVWKRLSESGWKCTHANGRVWCWKPRP